MANRERVEDLGRVAEMIHNATYDSIFNMYAGSPKHFTEWFSKLSEQEKDEFLRKMIYGIQDLEHDLSECWSIARWGDDADLSV